MNIQLYIAAAALAIAATTYAQPMAPPPGGPGPEPRMERKGEAGPHHGLMMESNFFCPELVMLHQKYIGLTADQQAALKTEMVNYAGHVMDLRWQQSAEKGVLEDLLKAAKPDEQAILSEEGKLLKIGDDLKLSRLTVLIHIKNALTPEQQEKMTKLQEGMEHHRWGGRMMREHHGWGAHKMHHEWRGSMGFFGGRPPANPL